MVFEVILDLSQDCPFKRILLDSLIKTSGGGGEVDVLPAHSWHILRNRVNVICVESSPCFPDNIPEADQDMSQERRWELVQATVSPKLATLIKIRTTSADA